MVSLNEIVAAWTTPAGTKGRTITYFAADAASIEAQRAALDDFLSAYVPYCATTVSYTVERQGRVIQDSNGQHIADWTGSLNLTASGTQTDGPVPDVAQVLAKWATESFAGGRRLQGRTFLPGLARANVEGGNVATGVLTAVATAGNALVGAGVGFGIWHRPTATSAGSFALASQASVWTEMATQRRRRG